MEKEGVSRDKDIRIGKLLVQRGVIPEEQLQQAMKKQEENTDLRIPGMIGEIWGAAHIMK